LLSHVTGRPRAAIKILGKRTCGRKRDKISGFKKLQSERLHNFFSTNKVGMIKSRQIIWVRHVTCILKKTM